MTLRHLLAPLALGLFVAGLSGCTAKEDDTADDTGEADADADGDSDTDGDSDPDAPVIEAADAYCYQHTTGSKFWLWEVNCTADDPQGADTILSFDTSMNKVVVSTNGAEMADYDLVCDPSGYCIGSFKETDDGVSCTNATSYTLTFTVGDEDGNVSEPFEVTGRQRS